MNRYVAELVGTFFLVLTIVLTAGTGGSDLTAPIAIAAVLMAVIYAGGHISDAHYNPAVTLAFWLRGRCSRSDVPGYLVAQALGAVLAALTAGMLGAEVPRVLAVPPLGPLVVAEVLFTFALCWVILNVATTHGTSGNGFYGLAIGCTVAAAILTVGPISGAVLNPAVALGLAVAGLTEWSSVSIYTITQIVGALLATWAFLSFVER